MTNLYTKTLIFLKGRYLGYDYYGNKYYQQRRNKERSKLRRWVVYRDNDKVVPALCYAWLHNNLNEFPNVQQQKQKSQFIVEKTKDKNLLPLFWKP